MATEQRIPRVVHLPGGYSVTVKQLSDAVADSVMGEGVLAQWDVDKHEVHLRKSRPHKERLEDLVHELSHCWVDWSDFYLGKSETS